jgi:hypothetical protein
MDLSSLQPELESAPLQRHGVETEPPDGNLCAGFANYGLDGSVETLEFGA